MSQAQTHRDTESLLAHADFLRALVSRLVADESTADDILQATWLSAIRHPPTKGGSVRAWLYRVAQNHVRQLRRGEGRRSAREQEVRRPAQVPSTADIVERESARRTVVNAVVGLPEPYREVILLRFYEDLPPRKVARALGIPVETVRTRTRRGLEQLRTRLDGEYENNREGWTLALLPLLMRPSAPALVSGSAVAVGATALVAALCMVFGWRTLSGDGSAGHEAARPGDLAQVQPALLPPALLDTEAAAGSRTDATEPLEPRAEAAARAPGPAPTASLSGRVVDSTGAPVIGAEVLGFAGARPTLNQDARGVITQPLARTVSGPGGSFRLSGLPLEFYLRAERDGLVSVGGLVGSLASAEDLTDVELVVTAGLTVHGRVVDSLGSPVANCSIELRTQARRGYVRPTDHAGLVTGAVAVFATMTDAEGEFRLRQLPAVKHFIRARHPDFAAGEGEVRPAGPTGSAGAASEVVVVLPAGARSRILVVDAEGRPLEQCALTWVNSDQIAAEARTDAQGRALLPAVPLESRGRVLARHPGMRPTYSEPLAAGSTVAMQLLPEQELSGTVSDEQGRSIAGARVEARAVMWSVDDRVPAAPRSHQDRGSVQTDSEGRFRLGGLGDGVHQLVVTVPGALVPGASEEATPGPEPVHIVVGRSAPGTASLRGRVSDFLTGLPVQALVLSARGPGGALLAEVIEDPRGEFEVELPTGPAGGNGHWGLAIRAEGYAPWHRSVRDLASRTEALEIELLPARDLHLVLRDVMGEPVVNARVVITDMQGRPVIANLSEGVWMGSIFAGPSGEVLLAGLPAERLQFQVRVPELPRLPTFEVDLSGTLAPEVHELRLPYDLSSPRRRIELELRGDTGRSPLRIEVLDEHGVLAAGWTVRRGEDGSLRIAKALRHLVIRFDREGLLTHRGQAWMTADQLTRDLGPQLLEGSDQLVRFAARVPREACTITVELPGGSTVTRELPAARSRLVLQLP